MGKQVTHLLNNLIPIEFFVKAREFLVTELDPKRGQALKRTKATGCSRTVVFEKVKEFTEGMNPRIGHA